LVRALSEWSGARELGCLTDNRQGKHFLSGVFLKDNLTVKYWNLFLSFEQPGEGFLGNTFGNEVYMLNIVLLKHKLHYLNKPINGFLKKYMQN
jgi:hypothetical protein